MRWAVGGRVLKRAREPEVDVRRRERGDEVEVEAEGRRVRVVGKCPVWKVEIGRRRWPERDLGSREKVKKNLGRWFFFLRWE